MTPEEREALTADGDRYYLVNYKGIGTIADPAFSQMEVIHSVSPIGSVLEIGCTPGLGWIRRNERSALNAQDWKLRTLRLLKVQKSARR